MSTQPTPQPSPGVLKFLNYYNTYASLFAATALQVKADLSQHEHTQAVLDSLSGAAYGLSEAVPAWAPDVQASLALAQTFIPLFVGLFHHSEAPPAAPAAQAAQPSPPAAAGVNQ